jgi:uncharacterized protein
MDITPLIKGDRKIINSYGAERFIISGHEYKSSIILMPGAVSTWENITPFVWSDELVEILINAIPGTEILLVGTGQKIVPIPTRLRQYFRTKNIHADVMDTGAACRTYNVLLSEERRVAAALQLV